jgi:hypothetical protein
MASITFRAGEVADPKASGLGGELGYDPPVRTSLIGVKSERFVRFEGHAALDGQTEESTRFAPGPTKKTAVHLETC